MKQVAHGDEVLMISISSGLVFGGLQHAVESFEESVGYPGFEPPQDFLGRVEEGDRDLDDGLDLASHRHSDPLIEGDLGVLTAEFEQILESEFKSIGFGCVGASMLAEQLAQSRLFLRCEVDGVLEPKPSGSFVGFARRFASPGFIHSPGQESDEVIFVQGDVCLRECLVDPQNKGWAHVAGERFHLTGISPLRFQEGFELVEGLAVSALARIENPSRIQINEHADIVMASPCGGFIDSDSPGLTDVEEAPTPLYRAVDESPKAGVWHTENAGGWRYRHVRHQLNGKDLEVLGESAPWMRPWNLNCGDFAVRSLDSGDSGMDPARVFEEVQVPPLAGHRIVDFQASKAGPSLEVHLDVKLPPDEINIDDLPRVGQTQPQSKQFLFTHPSILGQPTLNSEEPKISWRGVPLMTVPHTIYAVSWA